MAFNDLLLRTINGEKSRKTPCLVYETGRQIYGRVQSSQEKK